MHKNKQVLWMTNDLKMKKAYQISYQKQKKFEELSHREGKTRHSNWFWNVLDYGQKWVYVSVVWTSL